MEQYTDIDNIESSRFYGDGAYAFNGRKVYLFFLLFEMLIVSGFYMASAGFGWASATRISIVLNIFICLCHFGYHLLNKPVNYLSPDLLYLVAYFIFHMGYTVLWLFGIIPEVHSIFISKSLWPKTMYLVNLGIIGFLFGYVLAAGNRAKRPDIQPKKVPAPMWALIGLSFMIFSLAIHFTYILVVGPETFLTRGYDVFAHMEKYASYTILWVLMPQIFLIGFSVYIISVAIAHGTLLKAKFGMVLFGLHIFLLITEGARTPLVVTTLVLVLVYHYLIKPIKLRWLVLGGVLAMFLFGIIGIVRMAAAFDVSKLGTEYKYAQQTGQTRWYNTLVEAGGSVRTVNMIVDITPDEVPYWYGRSYVVSILHLVPYLQGILYKVNYRWARTAGDVLVGIFASREDAGLGFSMVAEGYLNFGIPGAFLHMMFLGIWIRRLYLKFASFLTPSRAILFFASMGIFIMAIRNTTNTVFAPILHVLAMAWLLKRVCGEAEVYVPDPQIDWPYEYELEL